MCAASVDDDADGVGAPAVELAAGVVDGVVADGDAADDEEDGVGAGDDGMSLVVARSGESMGMKS